MDAFETLVALLLEREGFWVRNNFKVVLTKDEKSLIGRPSSPRWDIDSVAYKGATNEVIVVECKSYLDSRGVMYKAFDGRNDRYSDRVKLFTDSQLRQVVVNRLVTQLVQSGSCAPSPKVTLCLVAGRVASEQDRVLLKEHFDKNGWLFWDDNWLRVTLRGIANCGYQNDVSFIVAKLLLRR